MNDWLTRLKEWARRLKRDAIALWIAARDPRTPFAAKVVAGCIAAYALSPIDLIPDFIPILGYFDELLLLPAGIALAIRMIPDDLMAEFRLLAEPEGTPRQSRWVWGDHPDLADRCLSHLLVGMESGRSQLAHEVRARVRSKPPRHERIIVK
ncbi:hypothetical protein REJC140_03445 [Pseudorhizobium endolithicum]|uniref:DUF1232 domain-containing protein n=1 Tax=Pseudorhizobium endolithicum TaxID=1191678 RepID=A0ABM8PKZ4_9HYPH|nr:hypothetical protein REJC140_03445 [Pseudorhizobium endolithicum]